MPRIRLKIKNNKANNSNNKTNNKRMKSYNNNKLINTPHMTPISRWRKFLNLIRMKIQYLTKIIKLETKSLIIFLLDQCHIVLEVAVDMVLVEEDIQDIYTTSIFNHQVKMMSLKISRQTTSFSKDTI